jgi:5-methylcytosine-specific restriction endonuclease McrA
MSLKKCSVCSSVKEEINFYSCKSGKNNLCAMCISCEKERVRIYRLKNKKIKIPDSPEVAMYKVEIKKEKAMIWRVKNIEIIRLKSRERYKNNPPKPQCKNKYFRERRKKDPIFKLSMDIRSSISLCLKRNSLYKKSNTKDILSCTFDFFSKWLDLSKYNKDSHLDHVIPISLAITEEEVLALNHYSNFQLLPSKENIRKGNRYIKNVNLQRVLNNHPNPNKLKDIVKRSKIHIIKNT